jgi:hypothetical protein
MPDDPGRRGEGSGDKLYRISSEHVDLTATVESGFGAEWNGLEKLLSGHDF